MIIHKNEPPFLGCDGMTDVEFNAIHKRWIDKVEDQVYDLSEDHIRQKMYQDGQQCGACAFYIPLTSDKGMDYGVCANAKSRFDSKLKFEHDNCEQYEFRAMSEEQIEKQEENM